MVREAKAWFSPIRSPEGPPPSPPTKQEGNRAVCIYILALKQKESYTSALKDMIYCSFHSLEPLTMVLDLKGCHRLLGRRQAEEPPGGAMLPEGLSWTLRTSGPRRAPCSPAHCLPPWCCLLASQSPMCPPGGALGERMSPGVAVDVFGAR